MKLVLLSLLIGRLVSALPSELCHYLGMYTIQNRIAGGESAEVDQFPFQVGVQTLKPVWGIGVMTAWCGGSLIARNIVLTAAHCMKGTYAVQLYLGASDLSKEEPGRQTYLVPKTNIIIHERYVPATAINDIALIRLPQQVTLNDHVKIVHLPRYSQKWTSFENFLGWISGWGSLGEGKGSPKELQYAQRSILPANLCKLPYENYHSRTQICLDGSNMISACRGDSGGPLTIVENDGFRTLIGLTSYGKPGGCENNFPVVFTRITAYLDWISFNAGIKIRE